MCEHELIGDYYRGCQHFHGRYYSGERVDCMSPKCKTSTAHIHNPNLGCRCATIVTNRNKVQSVIHAKHPDCSE
ncbi:hypothetical protein OH76DRAFT_621036 [Lentinus brumalis]|uniref:Uncharacterized protein n=1 Tax=Lentinus brumalis TaxID=2498619 RepID=A0A371D918_9APHY|nr:hypothetical protein OH76DRAFT_621036 [Polyporus brumalis]